MASFRPHWGALKQEYPEDRVRIASMGAIRKPDGSGASGAPECMSTRRSNRTTCWLSWDRPRSEVAWLVRQAPEQRRPPFLLLACRADSDSLTVFINHVSWNIICIPVVEPTPLDHWTDGGQGTAQPFVVPVGLCRRPSCRLLWTA